MLNTADLTGAKEIRDMVESEWDSEMHTKPRRSFASIELFAGAGALAGQVRFDALVEFLIDFECQCSAFIFHSVASGSFHHVVFS